MVGTPMPGTLPMELPTREVYERVLVRCARCRIMAAAVAAAWHGLQARWAAHVALLLPAAARPAAGGPLPAGAGCGSAAAV